jgi:hypothetical protein
MVLLICAGLHLFSLYFVALVQCCSCLFWRHYFRHAGHELLQTEAGIRIRKIFLVTMLIHFVLLPLFIFLALLMLFAGPVLGVSYFLITMEEQKYYTKQATRLCENQNR